MMMDRSHQENAAPGAIAPLGVAKPTGLQNHRAGFHDEHPAGDQQHERLMNQHRDDPQRSAQRQRAGVAHKYLRWVAVEPKKTQTGANHRRTKNGQLAGAHDMRNLQILGCLGVTRKVGQHHKNKRHDQRATDG